MAKAPGRSELRWFASITACAALFNLSNVYVTLRAPLAVVLWSSRLCLFFGGLHATAWFPYFAAQTRAPLRRLERAFVAGGVALSFLALVPGAVLANDLYTRTIPWLGETYADPPPTTFGLVAFLYHLAGLVYLFGRYLARWSTRALRASCIACGAIGAGVIHDGLASGGYIADPYLLDLVLLVLVVSISSSLVTSFVANGRALETSLRELAAANAELVKRERLAAIGELAAVVAHEVRNPLAVVFNALASLRKTRDRAADEAALLGILQEEAERLRDIVSDLLEFARPRPPVFADAALDEIARSAVDAACDEVGVPHDAVATALAELAPVRCDERLLRQAIVNLVTNALQAPGRRGPVRVRLARDGADVTLAVADDGAGVGDADRERVFTPFYTTRPTGTGLGLAVVRASAEAHDGSVTLGETPGGGATFTLRIPARGAAE